jgi:hypothetical protein
MRQNSESTAGAWKSAEISATTTPAEMAECNKCRSECTDAPTHEKRKNQGIDAGQVDEEVH